jgi:hypothetical protein
MEIAVIISEDDVPAVDRSNAENASAGLEA